MGMNNEKYVTNSTGEVSYFALKKTFRVIKIKIGKWS